MGRLREFMGPYFPKIIPVFSLQRDSKEVVLSLLMDVEEGKTKIRWKKFKDPTLHKYINAALYKYGMIGWGVQEEVKFRMIKWKWLKEIRIDYNNYEIYIPPLSHQEEELIMKLAKGDLSVFPFNPITKEQILIL